MDREWSVTGPLLDVFPDPIFLLNPVKTLSRLPTAPSLSRSLSLLSAAVPLALLRSGHLLPSSGEGKGWGPPPPRPSPPSSLRPPLRPHLALLPSPLRRAPGGASPRHRLEGTSLRSPSPPSPPSPANGPLLPVPSLIPRCPILDPAGDLSLPPHRLVSARVSAASGASYTEVLACLVASSCGEFTNLFTVLKVSVKEDIGNEFSVIVCLYGPNTDLVIDQKRELQIQSPSGCFTSIGGSALGPQFVAEALAPDNPPLKYEFGLRSCFMTTLSLLLQESALAISPFLLYALVSQMGSQMKKRFLTSRQPRP
ncbi:uncharacterized protein LOC120647989 [Panicum virgatum]|uniref:uncharacterized protein LOC120647989 n=1 Tax=Panicum virgatum TaxID=38727 RepID=UPI0019D52571|nr:uncharacterized protein LOC120647989 [Panicum virgatum]